MSEEMHIIYLSALNLDVLRVNYNTHTLSLSLRFNFNGHFPGEPGLTSVY